VFVRVLQTGKDMQQKNALCGVYMRGHVCGCEESMPGILHSAAQFVPQ
jgi:hypothetical protein